MYEHFQDYSHLLFIDILKRFNVCTLPISVIPGQHHKINVGTFPKILTSFIPWHLERSK